MRLALDRDLCLLHDLEQRRLRLRRRAVDLVGDDEIREHGAAPRAELPRPRIVDRVAGDVGRHEVGRELDAREAAADRLRECLDQQRLAQPRHAFDEHVPRRDEADQRLVDHFLLADDDLAHF